MKFGLLGFLLNLGLAAGAFAEPVPYKINLRVEKTTPGQVHVNFQTIKTYPGMCGRTTTELKLTLPQKSEGLGIPTPARGSVSFTTHLFPGTPCLAAFGPHRGGVTLQMGRALPALTDGYYALSIDGGHYGYLVLSKGSAQMIPESGLPQ